MKNLKSLFLFSVMALLMAGFNSCNNQSKNSGYPDLDLLSYGVPLKIKAPEGAVVNVDDMGIVQDITIKKDENFNLQILAGTAYINELSKVVEKQKADAIGSRTFSKIIEEFEDGFIFEKKYSETRISYDFRCVRLQGDKEFIFQTGLLGQFTVAEVQKMYDSVK